MKAFIIIITLTLKASNLPQALVADTNSTFLRILRSSYDVEIVISEIPNVERLWLHDPDAYLKSINQAVRVLETANTLDAKQAFQNEFASLMQKSIPTNEEQIASWIELKRDTILLYLNNEEIRSDKQKWLEIANFIGAVRSLIIPNYKNQGMTLSIVGGTPAELAQLQKDREQNGKNITADALQSKLWQTDRILTFQLLYNCHYRFPSNNPTNAGFAWRISNAAHLNDEERRKL
jgi:hypothetical protein